MGYHDIAKNKELKKMVKPELAKLAEEISNRPVSPAEQKVRDESRKAIMEELKKMKDEGKL